MRLGRSNQEELSANLLLIEDELKLKTTVRADMEAIGFRESSAALREGKSGIQRLLIRLFELFRKVPNLAGFLVVVTSLRTSQLF